ncbi:hypothetical protein J6G99_03405, partial [bacterium]|nr:hypothetical protein [bacterium]
GKDIIGFNGVNLGWLEFAGLKITKPEVPTPLYMDDYCTNNNGTWAVKSDYKTKYNIKNCCTNDNCMSKGDRWAGAMVKCKDMGGHLATDEDIAKIATYLYDAPSQIGDTAGYNGKFNTSKLGTTFAGLGSSWCNLWSSSEDSAYSAYYRYLHSSYTDRGYTNRYNSSLRAVCVK